MKDNDRTKLIIDIPKDYYKAICTRAKYLGEDSTILTPEERAIAKGSYLQTKYEDIKTDISQNVEIIDGKVYIKEYDLYQILHQHFVFKEEQGENGDKYYENKNVRGKRSKIFDVVTKDGQIKHIDLNNEE